MGLSAVKNMKIITRDIVEKIKKYTLNYENVSVSVYLSLIFS